MHDKIYDILMDQDEITWKSIIMELIKSDEMDPWDIDITLLTKRFVDTLKEMNELNLRVSGKVILAAAILLRIKSTRLVGADLMEFDRMLTKDDEESMYESEDEDYVSTPGVKFNLDGEEIRLIPRTPQLRKRKVSIYDLVDALGKALNVRTRRHNRLSTPKSLVLPDKTMDISEIMDQIHQEVLNHFNANERDMMMFSELVPSNEKTDKVYAFIPLLHLSNARKVDLNQKKHFDDFGIELLRDAK